jgi:O-succinylbenzoate synthase
MRIERLTVRVLTMRLKAPFRTSFGEQRERRFLLVEADCEGVKGLGEVVAFDAPLYSEEFTASALLVIERFLGPALVGVDIDHPSAIPARLAFVRRHPMAKSGLESAVWDAWAKAQGIPLRRALGGEDRPVPVGVSIGIQPSPAALVDVVRRFVDEGYRRMKLKIEPGRDVEYVAAVREAFPDVPLMVDANSAYRLADADHLARLDAFDLMMIEQPLGHDDIDEHAELQRRLKTPICLDESIHTLADAKRAIRLGACGVINIKVGRVGGPTEAIRIHDACRAAGIPVWCGGMLESGIGRAHNVAIATLPGFTLPGDTSASRRYWHEDIVEPEVEVTPDGHILPRPDPGIGYEPVWDRIERLTEHKVTCTG